MKLGSSNSFVVDFHFIYLRQDLTISPSWPGAQYVVQAGLKLMEIHLSLLPKCWD